MVEEQEGGGETGMIKYMKTPDEVMKASGFSLKVKGAAEEALQQSP